MSILAFRVYMCASAVLLEWPLLSIKKIRRIRACTHQRPQKIKEQYAVAFDLLRDALSAIFGLSQASDEELEELMKDQPLSVDASPTTLSPGYIADFNPEEDKEDPEEDPADHPADG
ncbi:hypothetical protein Tco_0553745 [Tanacetum coccineum]